MPTDQEEEAQTIADVITEIHLECKKIYGYRRMTLVVNKKLGMRYNPKRIRRIMRILGLYSVIRRPRPAWQRSKPVHLAENLLNREFDSAIAPNQIWHTDITEFKYGNGQKKFLSAIVDLWDQSIIAYVLSS
ncbi:IS3 family transposase [Enterococcus hirae]|nr:IS3 family transposase [Enterococcus hirae]